MSTSRSPLPALCISPYHAAALLEERAHQLNSLLASIDPTMADIHTETLADHRAQTLALLLAIFVDSRPAEEYQHVTYAIDADASLSAGQRIALELDYLRVLLAQLDAPPTVVTSALPAAQLWRLPFTEPVIPQQRQHSWGGLIVLLLSLLALPLFVLMQVRQRPRSSPALQRTTTAVAPPVQTSQVPASATTALPPPVNITGGPIVVPSTTIPTTTTRPISPEAPFAIVRVFYGTDRVPIATRVTRTDYTAGRGSLALGSCTVSIPRDHRIGHWEQPTIFTLTSSQSSHVMLLDVASHPEGEFLKRHSSSCMALTSPSAMLCSAPRSSHTT
jgi:hypothetical protein